MTARSNTDVREAINTMVRRLVETRDVDETLASLTAVAVDSIPAVHFASVSHHIVGAPIGTLAPTDPLVVALDELEYDPVRRAVLRRRGLGRGAALAGVRSTPCRSRSGVAAGVGAADAATPRI